MFYVKLNDDGSVDRYPYTLTDLRRSQPNVSFPAQISDETAADFGVYPVTPAEQPAPDHTLNFDRIAVLRDGTWFEEWTSTPATPEEIAERTTAQAQGMRYERNELLARCDWTQLTDSPLDADDKAAWALYRETLRMIPQQTGFPWNVNWPPTPGS
jgi:hypothetical protein